MQVDTQKKSNVATVIGNGPSRLQFDLHQIHAVTVTYGCNALYRDFIPDYLISHDMGIADEIVGKNIHYQTKFYTQHGTKMDNRHSKGEPINFVVQDKWMGDSGTGALRLACMHGYKQIYMIGFDYTGHGTIINNIYYGTAHYAPGPMTNTNQMMLTQWESRLRHWCQAFPEIEIIRVNGNNFRPCCKEKNFSNITPEQFKEKLNEL